MKKTHPGVLLGVILSVAGLLVRLPYFHLIPLFTDETEQAIHALRVWPGRELVLSGWDNYIGPFYSYLLGGLYFLFGSHPLLPRLLSLVFGALTVGLTYWLARAANLNRRSALLAAVLLLVSPHHILVNSHIAWSNSLLPFFSTAFLIVVLLAVYHDQLRWLLLAGVLIGLALQMHPIVVLMLPGVLLWFVVEPKARLRSPWPYLAFMAALLVFGVVIYHNWRTGFFGVAEAQSRAYIWQQNPTLTTYLANFRRLLTQFVGVAGGTIDAGKPAGIAFFYGAWLFAAWIHSLGQRRLRLLAFCFTAVLLIMPYFSNHYGPLVTTRLTNHLTPLAGVMMAALWLAGARWLARWRLGLNGRRLAPVGFVLVTAVVSLYPLLPLARYYDDKMNSGGNNREFFRLADLLQDNAGGRAIYLSGTLNSLRLGSSGTVAYTTNYFLTMAGIAHETLPAPRIFERLLSQPQEALLVLHDEDVSLFAPSIPLTWIADPANELAGRRGYGVYLLDDRAGIRSPSFIVHDDTAEPAQPIYANLANELELTGFTLAQDEVRPGGAIQLTVHWRALAAMESVYTGFAHLLGADGSGGVTLWGQDDHELGSGLYRTHVWRLDETIIETYRVVVPPDAPPGVYQLVVGAYEWPSLTRLPLVNAGGQVQDDKVFLAEISVLSGR